jgi:hypothetical protein
LVQKEDELKQVKEKLDNELKVGQEFQRKFEMVRKFGFVLFLPFTHSLSYCCSIEQIKTNHKVK